jgi:hypothetical protein
MAFQGRGDSCGSCHRVCVLVTEISIDCTVTPGRVKQLQEFDLAI